MRKLWKRMAACVMAAGLMCASVLEVSAGEVVEEADWSARYVNIYGAPGSDNKMTVVNLAYSTFGAKVYCNAASNTVDGASGRTQIRCLNFVLNGDDPMTITNIGQVICHPLVEGTVGREGIIYQMSAYTSVTGNVYNCSGRIIALKKFEG